MRTRAQRIALSWSAHALARVLFAVQLEASVVLGCSVSGTAPKLHTGLYEAMHVITQNAGATLSAAQPRSKIVFAPKSLCKHPALLVGDVCNVTVLRPTKHAGVTHMKLRQTHSLCP